MTTLLMSSRHTADDQALWRAAIKRGWSVVRARGIRLPEIPDPDVAIYVEALYGPTIAEMIGRKLLDPPDDWLVQVPHNLRKRSVGLTTLEIAREIMTPAFVKPPNDKSFAAHVYRSGAELPTEFDSEMPVLVAEPVSWEIEFRCFCLDGRVRTLSPYLRAGVLSKLTGYEASTEELATATTFAEEVLQFVASLTPRAIVIDVGLITGRGWAAVEANGAWGSGLYGCDPDAALDVIRQATVQVEGAM